MNTQTQWFNGKIKPIHIGLYQTNIYDVVEYFYWNGARCGMSYSSKSDALKYPEYECAAQNKPWRGLADKP